jgi:hypothetical protein
MHDAILFHEHAHARQEMNYASISLTDQAEHTRDHWYEDAPYPKTQALHVQADTVSLLCEAHATLHGHMKEDTSTPDQVQAIGEFGTVALAGMLKLYETDKHTGVSGFDSLIAYIADPLNNEAPVHAPEHHIANLILLTKNPRLIRDIREGNYNSEVIKQHMHTMLDRIAQNPATLSNITEDTAFQDRLEQELRQETKQLKQQMDELTT